MSILDPPPRLRDKLLQILVETYPGELRFSELYETAGRPSRSVFSEALRWLEKEKLVIRTEISYKYVTYSLNIDEYRRRLEERVRETTKSLEEAKKRLKTKGT